MTNAIEIRFDVHRTSPALHQSNYNIHIPLWERERDTNEQERRHRVSYTMFKSSLCIANVISFLFVFLFLSTFLSLSVFYSVYIRLVQAICWPAHRSTES